MLAACESHYGAYFVIEGDVELDQVELYFGTTMDSSGPGNATSFASPMFGAQQGLLFERSFDSADVALVKPTKSTTYYVPARATNDQLGAYVAAVALSGGKPVGIAEYFDFAVPPDQVFEYHLKLVPWDPQAMERWGETPGCVEWRHPRDRDPLVAVVHRDDRDCDTMVRDADCDDLCSAESPACAASSLFCNSGTVCALGCSAAGGCAPSMCLPPTTCTSLCQSKVTLKDKLACGAANTTSHMEIFVDRSDFQQACATDYSFHPGVTCSMPVIEAKDTGMDTGYTYTINEDPSDPTSCMLTVAQSPAVTFADSAMHHVLVSFAPQVAGKPRPTVVVGIQPRASSNGCVTPPFYTAIGPAPLPVYNCQ